MADIEVGHHWAPITNLNEDDLAAASTELPPLLRTWEEFRQELPELQVREFNERLQREWAIETGVIERLYTLDEGTTKLLIEQGIDASHIPHSAAEEPPELIAGMIADHLDAVEWLFDVITQKRPLSTSFVRELHQLMTRKQEFAAGVDQFGRAVRLKLLHGDYKRRPNNPTRPDGKVHEYCPPEHVAAEMDQLIKMHDRHLDDDVPADVSAAWLHHRFVQIHPFQDGNGRVARALASLALIRAGMFPLVVTNRDRERYIETPGSSRLRKPVTSRDTGGQTPEKMARASVGNHGRGAPRGRTSRPRHTVDRRDFQSTRPSHARRTRFGERDDSHTLGARPLSSPRHRSTTPDTDQVHLLRTRGIHGLLSQRRPQAKKLLPISGRGHGKATRLLRQHEGIPFMGPSGRGHRAREVGDSAVVSRHQSRTTGV